MHGPSDPSRLGADPDNLPFLSIAFGYFSRSNTDGSVYFFFPFHEEKKTYTRYVAGRMIYNIEYSQKQKVASRIHRSILSTVFYFVALW